jgi:hypothetical protein
MDNLTISDLNAINNGKGAAMKKTLLIICILSSMAIFAQTPESTPSTEIAKNYIIPAGKFPLESNKNCHTDTTINGIDNNRVIAGGGIVSMFNGKFIIWAPGAKHTWKGKLSYLGYTFASDASDPLQFMVNQQGGYQYIGGKGKVTQPDKQVIVLPGRFTPAQP